MKNIFEKQSYPDLRKYSHLWQGISRSVKLDGAPLTPYDGVGWTLPVQMGIDAREAGTPFDMKSTLIKQADLNPETISGSGPNYIFPHSDNHSFTVVNRILKAGGRVSVAAEHFYLNRNKYSRGTFVLDSRSIPKSILESTLVNTGISLEGGNVRVKSISIPRSRVALYQSWVANSDAGWIAYVLEKYEFPYHPLTDAEIKAGELHKRFDVIILPDQRTASIINGHRKGTMPSNYVGGMTDAGIQNLKKFIVNGGTLICNKRSCNLPIEQFNLPIRNVLQDVKSDSFNCPGSLLRMDYDITHPLCYGMPPDGIAYFSRGLVFEMIPDTAKSESRSQDIIPSIAARYPDESLLISGWMIGDEIIKKKYAVLDIPYGKGKIILFGFNVVNRAQAYSTFKLLFNAIYF